MEPMLLRVFQQQILLQCQFILICTHDLNAALVTGDTKRVFGAVQSILNASANVSKAFWGAGGRRAGQREELRDSIGVMDDSALRQVIMRNHFEHFDDRLDVWWKNSESHNHLDLMLGPPSAVKGLPEGDMFRVFDPKTTDLVFWGQSFNLQALLREVQRILPALERESRKPHWERPATDET